MRQSCRKLLHLGVLPLTTREITHKVRQETQQQDQHNKCNREILHRDIRIITDEKPCSRHTEDKFHYEQGNSTHQTHTNSCGEIALILEKHSSSRIVARMVRRDKGTYIAIIDLALCTPDSHRFGLAEQQTPFARLRNHIEWHEQKNSYERKPKPYISSLESREER